MSTPRFVYVCDTCGRPRSKEFHRRHRDSRGGPLFDNVCRRCRSVENSGNSNQSAKEQKDTRYAKERLRRAVTTAILAGRNLFRALSGQDGIVIHIHHHHWNHNARVDTGQENSRRTPDKTFSGPRNKVHSKKGSPSKVSELCDGSGLIPCELPASSYSMENLPLVGPKPEYHEPEATFVD